MVQSADRYDPADLRHRRPAAAGRDQQRRAEEHRPTRSTYISRAVWADEQGRNRAGVIVLQEQHFFAAREVMKVDARPGGYVATGGHGGILGGMGTYGEAVLHYVPARSTPISRK